VTSERRLKDLLVPWLNKNGYDVISMSTDRGPQKIRTKRGAPPKRPDDPDILAKRRGDYPYYYYIEAKGGDPTRQALYSVIGEINHLKVPTTPAHYAIAVPKSFYNVICKCYKYEIWKKNGFYILLVTNDGEVTELNPSKQNYERICSMA
jgi:hypothetical protein